MSGWICRRWSVRRNRQADQAKRSIPCSMKRGDGEAGGSEAEWSSTWTRHMTGAGDTCHHGVRADLAANRWANAFSKRHNLLAGNWLLAEGQ